MDATYEELEDCVPTNSIENDLAYNELVKEINSFLEKLSHDRRVIFLERYWYFNTIKDISSKYHQKESAIKMNLLRTRNELKKYLEQRGEVI